MTMPTTEITATAHAPATGQPERTPDPCIVVIFGASGDLTKRKIKTAVYHLEQYGLLHKDFAVVGVARRPLEQTFAQDMKEGIVSGGGVESDDAKLDPFVSRIQYHAMNFDDAAGYDSLKQVLADMDTKYGTMGNRLFYLATAPEHFSDIIKYLGDHCMARPADCGDGKNCVRIIIGKPFGHDLESAKALNNEVNKVFASNQIFRNEHNVDTETRR